MTTQIQTIQEEIKSLPVTSKEEAATPSSSQAVSAFALDSTSKLLGNQVEAGEESLFDGLEDSESLTVGAFIAGRRLAVEGFQEYMQSMDNVIVSAANLQMYYTQNQLDNTKAQFEQQKKDQKDIDDYVKAHEKDKDKPQDYAITLQNKLSVYNNNQQKYNTNGSILGSMVDSGQKLVSAETQSKQMVQGEMKTGVDQGSYMANLLSSSY